MLIKRKLLDKLVKSKKSILLIGPRQSGKSTLIKQLKPELEINLANEQEFVRFLSNPNALEERLKNHKKVFIDEIQRIPSLLNTVQYLIDQDKSRTFYLTGSSARKLKRGQANLLPGRILSYELGPLAMSEIEFANDRLQIILQKGLLPGVYLEEDEETWKKTLRTYATTYLKEEVQAEALTRNLEGFSRFFNVITSRSGDFLDISKFSNTAEIERTSAKRYFEILEDTLVIHSVEAFTKSSKRRLIQHPRYYLFDVGVLNGALSNFNVSSDRIGNLFEHLVLQMLKSLFKSNDMDARISVYRTDAGAEVDFIVEANHKVFAIEVKATKKIGKHDLRGLKSFSEFYGKKHIPLVIYFGKDSIEIDDIPIEPIHNAFKYIEQILL
jgi:predicted AAA+ superfamily ATPase